MRWRAVIAILLFATTADAASEASGKIAAVATSNRYATQTGLEMLRRGGNAADASVAVAFELASLGGGGTLVYYDAKSAAVWTLDFRENAPAGLTGNGPRSGAAAAGVPSLVAGMSELHQRFGSQPWRELLMPAIRASHDDLAKTLQRIASDGARDFYGGALASRIVEETKKAGGTLSLHDLSGYKAMWRAPIQITFNGYDIASVAPPSAGGIMLAEMLAIAGGGDLSAVHQFAEVERRAAFDRDRFFADTAGITYRDLLSEEHANQMRASIDPSKATATATLGAPAKPIPQIASATHFTIADRSGNIAAVTVSTDDGGFAVPGCGFNLNEAAKDVTKPGDRIPSSMTPTIVFHDHKPFLALGSSGGLMTPAIVLQVILGVTRSRLSLADAIDAPRYDQQAVPEDLAYEQARAPDTVVKKAIAMAHGVRAVQSIGDVNAVMMQPDRLIAVSDSRHNGVAGAM